MIWILLNDAMSGAFLVLKVRLAQALLLSCGMTEKMPILRKKVDYDV